MMDPQINFEDVNSPGVRQQFKDLMEDIIQLAPSDAAVRATLRFLHDRFLVDINIASTSAYMTVVDQAAAVSDLLDQVRTKLMGQIVDWRIHRFVS